MSTNMTDQQHKIPESADSNIPQEEKGMSPPFDIPGAPERVTIGNLLSDSFGMMKLSLINFGTNESYQNEVNKATWWRFWLYVLTGGVIAGLLYGAAEIFNQVRFASAGETVNVAEPFLVFLVTVFAILASIPVGCWISYWYVMQHDADASFLEHSYTIIVPWLAGSILVSLIGVISTVLFGGFVSTTYILRGGDIGLLPWYLPLFSLVALYVIYRTFRIMESELGYLYRFGDWHIRACVALFIVGSAIVYVVVDAVFSAL